MNKKTRLWAAAAALTFVLAGGGITFRMVQDRKATEAADAAQRAKWESAEQAAANQAAANQDAASQSAPDIQTGRRQVDYAFFATNEYSEQNAFNRQQLFKNIDYENAADEKLQHFSDAYREVLAVCRRISEYMPACDTFLFHASAIAVDGRAYLFAAKSGTGKSTHARLWRELLGERAVMINDDKPFVRITPRHAVVYGSPWNGKHRLGANICVPLKAVCILERSEKNHICRISPGEAWPVLLQQDISPAGP